MSPSTSPEDDLTAEEGAADGHRTVTPAEGQQPLPADIAELSYEAARDQLVEVVRRLESGQGGLEDSIELWLAAPSPGADPFVRVGDEVEPGQTVGIVEAMKLMNPIVADEAGVVAEVLVGDAESVEYDQVLMRLRPTGRAR